MSKKKIHLVEASQMLTGLNEKIYKSISDLFGQNDFGFISDKDTASKTAVWLDCAAINVLKNKKFNRLASELKKHRIKIASEGFNLDKSDVQKMYDDYTKLQKEALQISPSDFSLTHYLLSMGVDKGEAFTLSTAYGLKMPIEFGQIILNQAKAIVHLVADFDIKLN